MAAQMLTSTTIRSPEATAEASVTDLVVPLPCPTACCTNATGGAAAGVIAFDGDDGAPEPRVLDAVTVKVYEVPLVRPVTVTVVVPAATGHRAPT